MISSNKQSTNEFLSSTKSCKHFSCYDQIKLNEILTIIDQLWTLSYRDKYKQNDHIPSNIVDDFRQSIMKIIEKQDRFSEFYFSSLGNDLIEKRVNELYFQSKQTFKTFLTDDFNLSINIKEKSKDNFQPIKFLRSHHQSNEDLTTISVHMCAFEPNTSNNHLATCGGQKVCFINCNTCEITHLFEVATLRSMGWKIKDKNRTTSIEHFSCLCWIEIEDGNENLKILAVGATNGYIYLLSPKWKLMFGHIELQVSDLNMKYFVG